MTKCILFIDTESSIYNNHRVVYDVSYTLVNINKNAKYGKTDKQLRSRHIHRSNDLIETQYEKHFIVYEFAHLVPHSKQSMYGYANYHYACYNEVMMHLKHLCDLFKPDAIIGYNVQADFDAMKSTQSFLKTCDSVYFKNPKLPSLTVFKKDVCKAFDSAYKTDLMLYLSHHCPRFMDMQEKFAFDNNLITKNGFISRRLIDMYRFTTNNPNIEQMHMGYYDNMYAIKCLEKSILTDGIKYFPMNCMTENERKRKHSDEFTEDSMRLDIKFQHGELPDWFNDQYQNSKCLKSEPLEDIRKYHPDFGSSNKPSAPYFRGSRTRAGIWPPSYVR